MINGHPHAVVHPNGYIQFQVPSHLIPVLDSVLNAVVFLEHSSRSGIGWYLHLYSFIDEVLEEGSADPQHPNHKHHESRRKQCRRILISISLI